MTEKKKPNEDKETAQNAKLAVTRKKPERISAQSRKTSVPATSTPSDIWQAFDNTFARFRNDFEDILFPAKWTTKFSFIPEVRVPVVDLKDEEKRYVLTAEMPGFKKENIEIDVSDTSIAITGTAGWKYDEKGQLYICRERACKTFYREIELPEEIEIGKVEANLTEGVLEIVLPKKAPKEKRKIPLK